MDSGAIWLDLNSVYTKLIGQHHTHWYHAFTSSLPAQPPATLLWHMALPLCAPEACPLAALLWQLSNSDWRATQRTQLGASLLQFSSWLTRSAYPALWFYIWAHSSLLDLPVACIFTTLSLPPFVSCYCIPSGFVMYVCPLGVWEFLSFHSSAILS